MDRSQHHPFECQIGAQHNDPLARIRIWTEAGSVGSFVVDDGELVARVVRHLADGKLDEGEVLQVDDEAALVVVLRVAKNLSVIVSAAVQHAVGQNAWNKIIYI